MSAVIACMADIVSKLGHINSSPITIIELFTTFSKVSSDPCTTMLVLNVCCLHSTTLALA